MLQTSLISSLALRCAEMCWNIRSRPVSRQRGMASRL